MCDSEAQLCLAPAIRDQPGRGHTCGDSVPGCGLPAAGGYMVPQCSARDQPEGHTVSMPPAWAVVPVQTTVTQHTPGSLPLILHLWLEQNLLSFPLTCNQHVKNYVVTTRLPEIEHNR